jgi:hypothetical protein
MTLQEWIIKYQDEAEEFIKLPGFSIYYEPDNGFFCWRACNGVLEVDHCCTNDAIYMNNKAIEFAKQMLSKTLRTATNRNPATYMRFMKCAPNLSLSGIRPNGKMYWVFERKVI